MALDAQGNEVGKLFVGGLHQSTNTNGLHNYFAKFGDIEESIVMMDNRTGRSRGFGYVKFKEPAAVDRVLSEKVHVIDNKEVDPKKCNINMRGKNRRSLKVFVGGIALSHDEETIRKFFQSYGKVTDVNLLSNPAKSRHRGFAFVGFDDEEVVKKLIKLHFVNLNGKQVEIKPMEPPNPQRAVGYMSSGVLDGHNNGQPVRGTGRINSIHSNVPFDNWNSWNNNGGGGNGFDLSGGDWNHIVNHPTLTWNPQLPSHYNDPSVSPGDGPSFNSCWPNQMAAAFQPNGFLGSPHSWSSQQPPGKGTPDSGLNDGVRSDRSLADFNSWSPHQVEGSHHQQHSHHPSSSSTNYTQPDSTCVGAGSNGSGGSGEHFANNWEGASEFLNQWRTGSGIPLWNSAATASGSRSNHNDITGIPTGLIGTGTSPVAFKMDAASYRLAQHESPISTDNFVCSKADWPSALAVAAAATQHRSVLASHLNH